MLFKLELVAPYRETLASLVATLLDPRHELGALNPQMQIIRTRVMSVFYSVVAGATDSRKTKSADVVHSLYAAHLALMLLWTQDRSQDSSATRAAIDLICELVSFSGKLSWLPNFNNTLGKLETISAQFVEPESDRDLKESIATVKYAAKRVPLWVTLIAWSTLATTYLLFHLASTKS